MEEHGALEAHKNYIINTYNLVAVSRISFDFLKWRSTRPQKLTKMSL